MKLNRATRYALYAVLELARDPETHMSATEIAKKYGISANHLVKVLHDLGRARLVGSVRGAGGGHRFIGNAKRTTLLDVIELFEDVRETNRGVPEPGEETSIGQSLGLVLKEIEDIAVATLASISIATFLKTMEPVPASPANAQEWPRL